MTTTVTPIIPAGGVEEQEENKRRIRAKQEENKSSPPMQGVCTRLALGSELLMPWEMGEPGHRSLAPFTQPPEHRLAVQVRQHRAGLSWRRTASSRPASPVAAATTSYPLRSKHARSKRRIWISSSITNTVLVASAAVAGSRHGCETPAHARVARGGIVDGSGVEHLLA